MTEGVYVYFNCFDGSKITVKVTGFNDGIVYGVSEYGTHWCQISKIEPIPLTKENLEKQERLKILQAELDKIHYLAEHGILGDRLLDKQIMLEQNVRTINNYISLLKWRYQNKLWRGE